MARTPSRVRIVFPTAWDRQQLAERAAAWRDDFAIEFASPSDADCSDDFDVLGFIDAAVAGWGGEVDGVMSSSDYPGATVAAAIATGLGLPGTPPADSMRAAHKGLARAVQQQSTPSATPPFEVVDFERLETSVARAPLPGFVKPAKGCFSVLARAVATRDELSAFLRDPLVADYRGRYLAIYRRLVERYLGADVDGTAFVVEGLLRGRLVTVEAFATDTEVVPLGVVDSVTDPQHGSFVAFEYPSALPAEVQRRLEAVTARLGAAFGLCWTMFNVELMWDAATDRISIIELNARMCGQFADLYEKVDGVHGHRLALELACGRRPAFRRGSGPCAVAASYPLRVFEPVRVVHAPDPGELAAAVARLPEAMAWNEVATGDRLTDFASCDDGKSYRYAVLNVGADSRDGLQQARDTFVAAAGYRFERLVP